MKRKSCFFISIGPDQFEDLLYKFRYGITKHACYVLTSLKENPIKTNTFICEGIIANNELRRVVVDEGVYEFAHQHSATLSCSRSLLDDILI